MPVQKSTVDCCVGAAVPCAGPPGRGNGERRGRGPRPGQTLVTLPEGDGAGDWVGEARGLLASWVLAWVQGEDRTTT